MKISLCLLQPTKIKDFYDFFRHILGVTAFLCTF